MCLSAHTTHRLNRQQTGSGVRCGCNFDTVFFSWLFSSTPTCWQLRISRIKNHMNRDIIPLNTLYIVCVCVFAVPIKKKSDMDVYIHDNTMFGTCLRVAK